MGNAAKNILVVGGAGYLGSVLVPELLDRGYAVKVFDRLYYGNYLSKDVLDRIAFEVGDMRTISPSSLREVDAVINLGGLSNDPTAEYNPRANYEMNTIAAEKLARLCGEMDIQRYVLASSCSIYDVGDGDEAKDILLDESAVVDPKAAYSRSKYDAELTLLSLRESVCPIVLRMGTIFGFSPRMRYDLVVNTFVMSALRNGYMTMFNGGEMWRPMLNIRDAARAYIACLVAPREKVCGQIFNVVGRNYRISELALRVREGLRRARIEADVRPDYRYRGIRNYRVSGRKIERELSFRPAISVEDAVVDMVEMIHKHAYTDFDNPRYYNIRWLQLLEEAEKIIGVTGSVFEARAAREAKVGGGVSMRPVE